MKSRPGRLVAGFFGLLLAAAGALALAQFAIAQKGDGDLIRACVRPDGGLRMLQSDETCMQNEGVLEWSITGPKGEPGAMGPAGPHGPPGSSDRPSDEVIGRLLVSGIVGGDVGGDGSMSIRGYELVGQRRQGRLGQVLDFEDVKVVKGVDRASPELHGLLASINSTVDAVELQIFRPGTRSPYLTIQLEKAMLSSMRHTGTGAVDAVSVEELVFTGADKIRVTYRMLDDSEVSSCFEEALNGPCQDG